MYFRSAAALLLLLFVSPQVSAVNQPPQPPFSSHAPPENSDPTTTNPEPTKAEPNPCVCQDLWSSPPDGDDCLSVNGCPADDCGKKGYGQKPWCLVTDPTCDTVQFVAPNLYWSYCDYTPPEKQPTKPCECQSEWSSPVDGKHCAKTQYGCPSEACEQPGKKLDSWCLVTDPTCATSTYSQGLHWSQCEPKKCQCKQTWMSEVDGGDCGNVQKGCPTKSCAHPDDEEGEHRSWCLIEDGDCGTRRDDGDGFLWSYCDPDDYDEEGVYVGDDEDAAAVVKVTDEKADEPYHGIRAKADKFAKGVAVN